MLNCQSLHGQTASQEARLALSTIVVLSIHLNPLLLIMLSSQQKWMIVLPPHLLTMRLSVALCTVGVERYFTVSSPLKGSGCLTSSVKKYLIIMTLFVHMLTDPTTSRILSVLRIPPNRLNHMSGWSQVDSC